MIGQGSTNHVFFDRCRRTFDLLLRFVGAGEGFERVGVALLVGRPDELACITLVFVREGVERHTQNAEQLRQRR